MSQYLTDSQRSSLEVLCDTVVPRIERADDPDGFWARSAGDLGIAAGVEALLAGHPSEATKQGLAGLLDLLGTQGIAEAPSQASREQLLRNICLTSPEGAAGIGALVQLTLFLYYGAPDPATGQNPNWKTWGYPGPAVAPTPAPKRLTPLTPTDGATYEADVCVVGSGAGGSVVAAELAQRGLKVLVLEAGGYYNEADFRGFELEAYQTMYWRGGPTPTSDGNVSLQAGATLGGGTTINWTNCLRTKPWVREQWASEFGLEGLDGQDFDRHLDAIMQRIGATDACSELNGPQQRMNEAAEKLGWSWKCIVRNADPERYSPEAAGYMGFGDPSGAKLTTEQTYLLDAANNGAEFIVRCTAQRVLTENGRAVGVEAVADGTHAITVRAPQVVVAAGALESPALLLRSGLGGPAAGQYLRLHPCAAVFASYPDDQRAWWGAPQAGLVDEFADLGDGHGFLIEAVQYAPAIIGSSVAWRSAEEHKRLMESFKESATFIALTRDHGHGNVVLDPAGNAAPFYSVSDPLDQRNIRRGIAELIRAHHAAGAIEIASLAASLPQWRRGDDLEEFVDRVQRVPLAAGGQRLFSAHQMGTCRMGPDPETSVANPWGELHDTRGVWIGDASAFPTASGTNPMVTIMALARRTSEAIAAASTTTTTAAATA
jgi:choline dehydrogenase-like flavoprotein